MLQVLINSIDVTNIVIWNSFTWKPSVANKVDTLTFQLNKFGSRTYAPQAFDTVLFYDGGVLVFSGTVMQFSETVEAVDKQTFSITCKDSTHQLDRRLVIERYTNTPLVNIICDILNRYVNKGSRIELATFEPTEIWRGDGSADTAHYRVATQGRKLTSTNAVAAVTYRDIRINLAPAGYTTADFIEVDVYVDDISKLASAVMKLGDSTLTNYFSSTLTSQITQTGWNLVRVARSAFSSTGSPAWTTIARIRLEVTSTASNTVNVTFDNWQEVKTSAFTRDGVNSNVDVVSYIACNYEEPSKIFQRLADFFQLQWYVDPEQDIHFFARFDNPAPFNLEDDTGNYVYNSLVVSNTADQIRNGIYVRGGDYLAGALNETLTQQADGVNRVLLLGYKYANYSLMINGVIQAVGVDNINQYTDNNAAAQVQTGLDVTLGDTAARTKQSQQVVVTASGKRSKILLRLKKVGAPLDNFQVQIFSDSANAPSGTNLSTIATLAGTTITTSYVEYTFILTPASAGLLTLTQPTSYHIVLSRSGANDASNYYQIDAITAGVYEGLANTYNAAWSLATADLYFYEKIDFDVLYSFNEKILVCSSAPTAGVAIVWNGQPYLPIIVRYSDPVSVSEYGDYEYRIIDPSIRTQNGAHQRASAELLSFAQNLQDVKFTTYKAGLQVGQTITIQSDNRNLDLTLIIMSITGKARTSQTLEYQVVCALTKTMGLIYWMQQQLNQDSQQIVVDDNELFDRVDGLSETVYLSTTWSYLMLVGHVWSNDAGTTPNHGIWNGGASYIWV